jgi:catechol 2,3-dioxygenase-like lactoylglutathione lyase family enzyme
MDTLDHIGLSVSNYAHSKSFFTAILSTLGISLMIEVNGWAGFGKNGHIEFWLGQGAETQRPMHIAFVATTRAQVRDFYAVALQGGATDNGPPGLREIYHPDYYGAFVTGPDGHNIEAVCRLPEP